jgi:hypothetical protein
VIWRGCVLAAALCLGVCTSPWQAGAHSRSVSYSSWQRTSSGATVRLRISLLELSRLGLVRGGVADLDAVAAYLTSNLELNAGSEVCVVAAPAVMLEPPEGWMHVEWRFECAASGALEISSRILLEAAPGHLHFARLDSGDGSTLERVLTEAAPSWRLDGDAEAADDPSPGGTSLSGYVALGVAHILSGWDHLAFVLALLLLAGGAGEVARLVTGFTLAHSVTLGLAVLGILTPDSAAVEALIGFSIALVAAENAWLMAGGGRSVPIAVVGGLLVLAALSLRGFGAASTTTLLGLALFSGCHFLLLKRVARPQRLRVAVAFAFGLVHGFGFAGVLAEMSLPTARLAPALFGFNVGVELGQLAVVILAWPLLRCLEQRAAPRFHRGFSELATAAICGLGLFWFVTRTLE